MQDQNTKKANSQTPTNPTDAANTAVSRAAQSDFVRKIVDKINNSENILIALSRDPSVDEIAAALGLTMYLDGVQKHATAIYSGRTPNALEFLQPKDTFETNTDSLQDFIIALSKDKADHLRYKLEGDFVKVFITPYKKPITKDDLTFSHGDYNVNFVIAINVPSASKLDEALREHGRIMHDASAVNITTGQPGRFGEIEWSNPAASSLCEMVTELIFALKDTDDTPLDKDVATALLTGIVAATDRFSNGRTNSDTLSLASKLMSMGADQQLITSNIKGNEIIHNDEEPSLSEPTSKKDSTSLTVDHEPEPTTPSSTNTDNPATQAAPTLNLDTNPTPANAVSATNSVTPGDVTVQPVIPGAPATTTTPVVAPSAPVDQMQIPGAPIPSVTPTIITPDVSQMQIPGAPQSASRPMATSDPTQATIPQVGATIQPPAPSAHKPKNYAEMMEEALAEPTPGFDIAPIDTTPVTTSAAPTDPSMLNLPSTTPPTMEPISNPTTSPILPPPPTPLSSSGVMPPVLPPVQTPPGMV